MKIEDLREDLRPYYDKADCCHYIVEYRKENFELKEQLKKKQKIIDKAINWTIKYQTEWCQEDEVIRDLKQLLSILEDK